MSIQVNHGRSSPIDDASDSDHDVLRPILGDNASVRIEASKAQQKGNVFFQPVALHRQTNKIESICPQK